MRGGVRWNGGDGRRDDQQQRSSEDGKVGRRMVAFDVLFVGFGASLRGGPYPKSGLDREENHGEGKESNHVALSVMHSDLKTSVSAVIARAMG